MLSGEILVRSPLSVVLLPPPSLIEFCRIMAAIATLANQQNIDDDDIFLGNFDWNEFVQWFYDQCHSIVLLFCLSFSISKRSPNYLVFRFVFNTMTQDILHKRRQTHTHQSLLCDNIKLKQATAFLLNLSLFFLLISQALDQVVTVNFLGVSALGFCFWNHEKAVPSSPVSFWFPIDS